MILLQRVGSRVPHNYTVEQAMRAALVDQPAHFATVRLAQAILRVLTEDQQVRVLEQLGWARCPGPVIEGVAA